jgi:hypothetical protein
MFVLPEQALEEMTDIPSEEYGTRIPVWNCD